MSTNRQVDVAMRSRLVRVARPALRKWIVAVEAAGASRGLALPPGPLSLAFLDEPEHAELHARFLGDPSPTDVITFPAPPGSGSAGEVCVSVPMAIDTAARLGVTPARELALYVVHGWLHLAGLDDLDPAGRRAMRAAERAILARADTPSPELVFRFPSLPS